MNANLMTKKIEMSKSEAKEAGKLNTEKFHELRQFMAAYPGYEVQIKAPGRHKVELRGLDYKYMREYIQKHDDEQHSKMEKLRTKRMARKIPSIWKLLAIWMCGHGSWLPSPRLKSLVRTTRKRFRQSSLRLPDTSKSSTMKTTGSKSRLI